MAKPTKPAPAPADSTEKIDEKPSKKPAGDPLSRLPLAWVELIAKHWATIHRAEIEYRAGARGPFVGAVDCEAYLADPRGSSSGAREWAQHLWGLAVSHCDETGGPIDYRLVLWSETGERLAETTRASRIDTTSPDGRVRELRDDDGNALLRAATGQLDATTRALAARDRGIERIIDACATAMNAMGTALASLTTAAAEANGKHAETIRADADAWLAKAEFLREREREQFEEEDRLAAREYRQGKMWDWLDKHGEPIADGIGLFAAAAGDALKTKAQTRGPAAADTSVRPEGAESGPTQEPHQESRTTQEGPKET